MIIMTMYDHTSGSDIVMLLITYKHFIVKSKRINRLKNMRFSFLTRTRCRIVIRSHVNQAYTNPSLEDVDNILLNI